MLNSTKFIEFYIWNTVHFWRLPVVIQIKMLVLFCCKFSTSIKHTDALLNILKYKFKNDSRKDCYLNWAFKNIIKLKFMRSRLEKLIYPILKTKLWCVYRIHNIGKHNINYLLIIVVFPTSFLHNLEYTNIIKFLWLIQ